MPRDIASCMKNATSRLHTINASAQDVVFSVYGFIKYGDEIVSDLEPINQTDAAVVYGAGRKVISGTVLRVL
jgi:hypothetical protein